MKYTLLILAGGLGRRFKGKKQLSGIGSNDELLIEYSIWDAMNAGFTKVVLLTNEDCIPILKNKLSYLDSRIELYFINQFEHDPLYPDHRERPWGTGHAVLSCSSVIEEPFLVVNADDFYGAEAYQTIRSFIRDIKDDHTYGNVVFKLGNTLSERGGVSRGVCTISDGLLLSISEHTNIVERGGKASSDQEADSIPLDAKVSMNCWIFQPSIFNLLKTEFDHFYKKNAESKTSELYLPDVVDYYLNKGDISVRIFESSHSWFGMTFADDLELCKNNIEKLINKGNYPRKL